MLQVSTKSRLAPGTGTGHRWQLDVTFKEDHMRARIGHSAENLATIKRMALNMLKQDGTEKRSLRRKRKLCSWRKDYLLKIIFGANFEI